MIRVMLTAIVMAASAALSAAQDFPMRPVKIIVPYAAGGPTDVSARFLGTALAKQLKQSVFLENIGGAGGNIGTARAAASEPDGYTLLFNNVAFGASPFLQQNTTYDPVKDFEPLGISAFMPTVLISKPDFTATNLAALIQHLKSSGGSATFANSGPGGTSHLCQVLFLNAIGAQATSVAYRGSAPAMNDVATGRVDLLCDGTDTAGPQIQAGRIKAFGVTSLRRVSALPDVPTLDELGVKGFDFTPWFGLFVPKKTPPDILTRLRDALTRAVSDPEYREALAKLGSEAVPLDLSGSDALKRILDRDIERWNTLLRGVQTDQQR